MGKGKGKGRGGNGPAQARRIGAKEKFARGYFHPLFKNEISHPNLPLSMHADLAFLFGPLDLVDSQADLSKSLLTVLQEDQKERNTPPFSSVLILGLD